MFKYCIASTFEPDTEDALTIFYGIRNNNIAWPFNIADPAVIWYDTREEAESNLLEEGEFVISSFFPTEALLPLDCC